MRKPLHADKKATTGVFAAGPLLNIRIELFPSTEVEIADAEIGAVGELKSLLEGREETKFYVIKDAWHCLCNLIRPVSSHVCLLLGTTSPQDIRVSLSV
jgi:hypothetical protein